MTDTLAHVIKSMRTIKPDFDGALDADTEIASLEFSSLDEVQLMMTLEDTFDIEISQAQASKCRTVGELGELVESLMKG
jgi:acyl carrier protein